MSATPQNGSLTAANDSSVFRKQPVSWADMEDDGEDWAFDLPVQTLHHGQTSPSTTNRTNTDDEFTPDRANEHDGDFHTVATKATAAEVSTVKKRLVSKKVDDLSPSRALLPDFAEIVVDNLIPYQFKSTASTACAPNNSTTSDLASGPLLHTYDVLQALSDSGKSDKKAAKGEPRRAKAIRTLIDALGEAAAPVACDDLSRQVNWNRKFRPALGCLFTFLKKHRDTFSYSKGLVAVAPQGAAVAAAPAAAEERTAAAL